MPPVLLLRFSTCVEHHEASEKSGIKEFSRMAIRPVHPGAHPAGVKSFLKIDPVQKVNCILSLLQLKLEPFSKMK